MPGEIIKLKKSYESYAIVGLGHSIIYGNVPSEIGLPEGYVPEVKGDRDLRLLVMNNPDSGKHAKVNMGLFESSSPNLNTFYPGLKADDLKIREEDFVNPLFRLLSEVIVNPQRSPLDFSKNGVLKASLSKLVGQTVYVNHDTIIGNQIGAVASTVWQEAYTTDTGLKVPAGINGILKIDAKSHPTIARAVMMDPPSIHSNSVSVSFLWEPSHKFESENEFFDKMGTFAKDGTLIRRIATEIKSYHETSLVAHGADGFAQRIKENGQIVNPLYGSTQHKLSKEDFSQKKPSVYYFNFQDPSEHTTLKLTHNNPENPLEMKKLLITLATAYNLSLKGDETDEQLSALVEGGIQAAKTAHDTALTAETKKTADLQTKLDEALAKVPSAEDLSMATLGKEFVTELRTEVESLYTKLKGDKVDATILGVIKSADKAALVSLQKDYAGQLEAEFKATCTKCGSHDITRMSATQTPGEVKDKRLSVSEVKKKQGQSNFALDGKV